MVLAGPTALGTGAACLAATRPNLIRQARLQLANVGIDIADKSKPFWVLVKGSIDENGMIDEKGVRIVEVGTYT